MPALAEGDRRVCFHSYMTGLKTSQLSSVSLNTHTHTPLKLFCLFLPFQSKESLNSQLCSILSLVKFFFLEFF